jgi:hypothetical protein
MEWQDPVEKGNMTIHVYRVRRLTDWLRSSLPRTEDRIPGWRKKPMLHINFLELLAATFAIQTFSKEITGHNPAEVGLHISSGMHQQPGKHSLSGTSLLHLAARSMRQQQMRFSRTGLA